MATSTQTARLVALGVVLVATLMGGLSSPATAEIGQPWMRNEGHVTPNVLSGYDVLLKQDFAPLHGKKIGLIVNHSAVSRDGQHLADVLHEHPEVEVVALFAPEHGIRGDVDHHVDDTKDEKTGLPIYSLYGQRRTPDPEMLAGIDLFVYDIQDIGARFYTYIATMGNCMRIADEHGIAFMVLDRPNPIQGNWFDGPIQDEDLYLRFTAYVPMPVTHGMTVGEMAHFFQKYHEHNVDLTVIPMEGWTRDMYFNETGLPWVNPSPNMRSLTQEILYTMVALTEAQRIVSVGRGTERPFEYLGAPWVDGQALADEFNSRNLPGLWFMAETFTPTEYDVSGRKNYPYQYTGEVCHGVRIVPTDIHAVRPVEAGIHMLEILLAMYPEQYNIDPLRGLVGAQWVLDAIKEGTPVDEIVAKWRSAEEFHDFARKRAEVLMY